MMWRGRIASATDAYDECLRLAVRGTVGRAPGFFAYPSRAFTQDIELVANLDGDARDDLVSKDAEGLRTWVIEGSGLGDFLLGSWPLKSSNRLVGAGDFDGDGRDDLIMRD